MLRFKEPAPTSEITLICGLGNPGDNYANTRHNCGFMAVDLLAAKYGGKWAATRFKAQVCRVVIGGQKVLLTKPQTYMNNSGEAVRPLLDYYRIPLSHLIVIYDDLDISLGTLRIREKGSAGTHNGMKSLVQHLGTSDFSRIRVGIGPKPDPIDIVDFVIGNFRPEEKIILNDSLELIPDLVYWVLTRGVAFASNQLNLVKQKGRAADV